MKLNKLLTTSLINRTSENLCDFSLEIVPTKFQSKSFSESTENLIKYLNPWKNRLYVAYSGGLDSEYVLKSFNKLDAPITPVMIETPYNKVEVKWAYNYCKDLVVIKLTKEEFIHNLKIRTVDRGFPVLLGGLPLIIADFVKSSGGSLITGYGDPFHDKENDYTNLAFTEWDYYLDVYDDSHVSGFFSCNIDMFYWLIKDIDYSLPLQEAKSKLYGLKARPKMYWSPDFYNIQSNFLQKMKVPQMRLSKHKNEVLSALEPWKI